jgi:hypothetical protein
VALAAGLLLAVLGRGRWFYYDEWEVLATRHATSAADLFRPHNEHWITLEVLVYRALAATVGLRSYLPYQAVVVALHLTVAVLVRVVMRRAGVGPWTATLAAGLLLLLGGGDQNIVWAFRWGS